MAFHNLTEEFIRQRLYEAEHQFYDEVPLEQFKETFRRAAVLIPLARVGDDWHILYTRRTEKVEHHKGQVSFPGGRTDPEDLSPEHTALRETEEEIGISASQVKILGRLGEYRTITNYLVTPVVGVIPWPACFKIHTVEVGRVFTIPLAWLADHTNHQEFVRKETGKSLITFYPYDGELLWGATARITVNFIKILGL